MATKVGALLEQLMFRLNVDDNKLSKATKVAKANISRLRNDPKANPTLATLKPLAEFFGVTVSQLLGEAPLSNNDVIEPQIAFRIPILEWNNIVGFVDGKRKKIDNWLSTEHGVTEHSFAVRVTDHTMVSLFPLDALLIIDKSTKYQDGMHVLVCSDDNSLPFLRQYLVDGNVRLLKSLKIGANWVEPLTEKIHILGAVIEVRYQMETT